MKILPKNLRSKLPFHSLFCPLAALCWLLTIPAGGQAQSSELVWLENGSLNYAPFAMEGQTNAVNFIPDFSHAGYMGGGVALPDVPAVITLSPSGEDDTEMIQAAIDEVEAMAPDDDGFRGAVLLQSGCYEVEGQLYIEKSGVVLRGEGQGIYGTVLYANLRTKHDFITVQGTGSGIERDNASKQEITTPYVHLGAYSFEIEDASAYSVGDTIVVRRTPNQQWINDTGMEPIGWTPSSYTINHERVITGISGNTITINVPIVDVMEEQYGGGEVYKASVPGRIRQCGVENLRIESIYDPEDLTDEEHAWTGVLLRRVTDSWVKNVTGQYLGFGTVTISAESNFNTVQDCAMLDHKVPVWGGRRYSFTINDGMGNLLQRNYSRNGRHTFATGSRVTGPNVFLDCYSAQMCSDSGPHHRWATGTLYDNIRDGEIRVRNRGTSGSGHGWAGNTNMLWNVTSVVGDIWVESPPAGMNWGIGCVGTWQRGDGYWEHWDAPVQPRSLYLQQLEDRLGQEAVANVSIPEQLSGGVYELLESWAGEREFGEPAQTKFLIVSEDAHVRGGQHADSNYGSEKSLDVRNTGEGHSDDRKSFIKFDLTNLSEPIYNVRLRMSVRSIEPNLTEDAIHFVPDDSWSAETLTYNNQPTTGMLVATDTLPPEAHGNWIEFDVTTIANNEISGDGILSLRISELTGGESLHAFNSKQDRGFCDDAFLLYDLIPGGNPTANRCERLPTGTKEDDFEATDRKPSFTLAPNPVQDFLQIYFTNFQQAAEIQLFNVSGELILSFVKAPGVDTLEIPVANLPSGLYLLRVGQQAQKFIKL
jgi:hypothetical protein